MFSCTGQIINAEEIQPDNVHCGVSRVISNTNDSEILTAKSKKFYEKLKKIGFEKKKTDFNLFVSTGLRGSKGYKLDFNKVIKNQNILEIHFIETKPLKGTAGASVPVYPFCLLKIDISSKLEIVIQ